MYHIRLQLHKTAYRHKVCSAIELMLVDAFEKANKVFKFDKMIENIEEYCQLNDSIIDDIINYTFKSSVYFNAIDNLSISLSENEKKSLLDSLRKAQNNIEEDLKEAKDIVNRIETRKLYKFIGKTILLEQQAPIDNDKIKKSVRFILIGKFPSLFFLN